MNFPVHQFQQDLLKLLSAYKINEAVIITPLPRTDKNQDILCTHVAWNKDKVLQTMERVKETSDRLLGILRQQDQIHK